MQVTLGIKVTLSFRFCCNCTYHTLLLTTLRMGVLSRLLFKRRRRQALRISPQHKDHDVNSTLSTIAEEGLEDDHKIEGKDDWQDKFIDLLSSVDVIDNEMGLRMLLETTRDSCCSEEASLSFIYGDAPDEIKLRQIFVRFLTNDAGKNGANDEHLSDCGERDDASGSDDEYWSDSDEEDDNFPRGEASGMHHGVALQILSSVLDKVSHVEDSESKFIDFLDPFWKRVVGSLINNIETNYSSEITKTTLLCFRILHTLEPVVVEPFLNQVLLPYLLHLRDNSLCNGLLLLHSEASRLIARADNHYTKQLVMV